MTDETPLENASIVQRVVLLGLTWKDGRDDTPNRPDEIRRVCNDRFDAATGRLSEADVARALNALSATSLVAESSADDRSPAGKGRPVYGLAVDGETVVEGLQDDEVVGPLLDDDGFADR